MKQGVRILPADWTEETGTEREFAQLYESYLDAVYRGTVGAAPGQGRLRLIESVKAEIQSRGATRILDCSAGTGFPALGLLGSLPPRYTVHTTDASRDMLDVLRRQGAEQQINLYKTTPPRLPGPEDGLGEGQMRLDWNEIDRLPGEYDYVMCRGNSLVYASSWGPGQAEVASSELIEDDLRKIAARVGPGGYLHVDAPRSLGTYSIRYAPVVSGAVVIDEEVKTLTDRRRWRLIFTFEPTEQKLRFELYSTRLVIDGIGEMLRKLGFENTEAINLPGERPSFGVIIARKPV